MNSQTNRNAPYAIANTFCDGLLLLPRGIGLLLWIEMLQLWPDLTLLYGPASVYDAELLPFWHSISGWSWEEIFRKAHPIWIHLTATAYSLCCLFLVFGKWIRYSSILLLLIQHGLFMVDLRWTYGADYLAQTGLLFSIFFSYTAQSESQLTWQRKGVYAWQAQLVLVYFFGGLGKAMGPTWWNGEAIWKAVQQPFPGNLIDIPLSWGNWTICWGMMGIGIVLLELGYVLAWIGTMYRRIIYIAAIAMHLSIALTIGLYHFSALMIWYNLCAWYYPYRRQTSIPIHNSSLGYADTDAAGTVRPASIQYKERR
ncbi:hypothetical protein SAMN05660841_04279 [Sphingobacterium nematocida]|uniref:HTTM-like domain-containing protein n=1 Tax=Sphingobacterium nematocida TaxID=1513896 RepID=A0A1T5GQJ7_9SPHI|nr:hypothetical protein [Sphingobacterium nematocida]SKC10722.1 hypothetical protein SAMN05660841_04279 [Sphingobacterium nematocida]